MISASIIVKNEESVMQRCLECVSKWADEIIVVDTGSTDRTKEIAATNPKVKLYDSAHFGKDTSYKDFQFNVAKNEAIAKCTGDFIVWWDADDYIDDEGASLIRKLASETVEDCLFSFSISYGVLLFEHCRMFKNGGGIEFDKNHSCHEYLNTGGRPQYFRKEIVVQHRPGKRSIPSNVRNLGIMEKDYFERGFKDQRTMFYLGNTYRESGRHDDAVKMYDEYLKVSQWKEERYFACLYKAQVYSVVGNFPDAYKALYQSLIEDERFAESYCLMGDILLHQKNYKKARHWYEMALAMDPPADSRLFLSKSAYHAHPTGQLAKIDKEENKESIPEPVAEVKPAVEPERIKTGKTGKEYKYYLPEDKRQALLAVTALSYCFKQGENWVSVEPKHEWQRELVGMYDNIHNTYTETQGAELRIPDDLKGKSEVEWYCRAAGFVRSGPFPEPINWETDDVA